MSSVMPATGSRSGDELRLSMSVCISVRALPVVEYSTGEEKRFDGMKLK